jgi:hypothetical protein
MGRLELNDTAKTVKLRQQLARFFWIVAEKISGK